MDSAKDLNKAILSVSYFLADLTNGYWLLADISDFLIFQCFVVDFSVDFDKVAI